jgi:hypothetical protein
LSPLPPSLAPCGRDAAVLLAVHDLAEVAEVLDEWRARPDTVSPPNS